MTSNWTRKPTKSYVGRDHDDDVLDLELRQGHRIDKAEAFLNAHSYECATFGSAHRRYVADGTVWAKPAFRISIGSGSVVLVEHKTAPLSIVAPEEIVRMYYLGIRENRRRTLDQVSASLETWRRGRNFEFFENMFAHLYEMAVNESNLPLMLSVLGESYLIRNYLPERTRYRTWLIERSEESIGLTRTSNVFSLLQ